MIIDCIKVFVINQPCRRDDQHAVVLDGNALDVTPQAFLNLYGREIKRTPTQFIIKKINSMKTKYTITSVYISACFLYCYYDLFTIFNYNLRI